VLGQFGELKSGTQRGTTMELSLTQTIPLLNKLSLRKELAQVALEGQTQKKEYFKLWIEHQVLLAAWRAYVTQILLEHGREREQRYQLIYRYLESSPRVSPKQKVEIGIISAQLVKLEQEQSLKELTYQQAVNDLEFWLGKKVSVKELILSIPSANRIVSKVQSELNDNLEFRQGQRSLKQTQLEVKVARRERMPDLIFGGGYRVENVNPVNHFNYAIVGINIPLWDTGNSKLAAAKARELREQHSLGALEKTLALKTQQLQSELESKVKLLQRLNPMFTKNHERKIAEAEAGFRQGLLDVNTFLQAETLNHELIDQSYNLWMDYLTILSSAQLMQGQELKWESAK
jgi:hypothetical protein